MQTYYKHVAHNEPFVFQGTKFIKTNHQRGYVMVDGRKQFRTFKPSAIVEITEVADKCNEWRQVKRNIPEAALDNLVKKIRES